MSTLPLPRADGWTRLQYVHEYMNRTESDPWMSLVMWMVALSAGTLLLILALRHARWQRGIEAPGHPWRLFRKLLAEAGLRRRHRRLLHRLARRVCPECPAAILMAPGALHHAVASGAAVRPGYTPEQLLAELAPASAVLFAAPAPAPASEPT